MAETSTLDVPGTPQMTAAAQAVLDEFRKNITNIRYDPDTSEIVFTIAGVGEGRVTVTLP